MKLISAYLSDIGVKRSQNQDSAGLSMENALFIVADGMGGHQGGEVASQMAVSLISQSVNDTLKSAPLTPADELIVQAVRSANQAILKKSRETPQLAGMGTTVTVLHFSDGKAWIGQVGDSRCYLIRDEGVYQLTRDHSLVQEKLRAGMIARHETKTDKMKNVITRSVGFDPQLAVDIFEYEPQDGDLFLMCSDGLSGPVDDYEIHRFAKEHVLNQRQTQEDHLKNCISKLIDSANQKGGDDNVTVMMTRYSQK